MKKLVITGSFIASLLVSTFSHAAYIQGTEDRIEPAGDFYMAVHGGLTDFGKTKLDSAELVGTTGTGDIRYDLGYHGALAYGYHFDPACIRAEGQLMYSRVPLKSATVDKAFVNLSGSASVISFYLNGIYEFISIGANSHPYVGLGVGANHLRFVVQSVSSPLIGTITGIPKTTTNRFGYQFIVGMFIHRREGFAVDLSYRNRSIMAVPGVKGNLNTQHFSVGINFDVGEDI